MATKQQKNDVPKELFVPHERKEDTGEKITKASRSFFQDARRTFYQNKMAALSIIVMLIIILMSIIRKYYNEYGMDERDVSRAKMPARVPVIEDLPFLGMNGTLTSEFKGDTVEEATENAIMRYDNAEDYIDIKVLSEGDGSTDSAEVSATYHIY